MGGIKGVGGKISGGAKDLGGKISDGAKDLGGKISDGTKGLGGELKRESDKFTKGMPKAGRAIVENLLTDLKATVESEDDANKLALRFAKEYKKESGNDADFDDCVLVVSAACAAAGAYYGGIGGAALGAAGGAACGRIACRRICPPEDKNK